MVIIVGVSGSGKTMVVLNCRRSRLAFSDADEFHSEANVAK
jgi:gluconate kinase